MKNILFYKSSILGIVILFFSVNFGASFEPLSCDANGPYEGNIMDDIEFESSVTGGIPPYDYFWDYGDGNSSSGDPHPTHNYANAGNYTVVLTVTDSINDTVSDTTWANINSPPNIPIIDGPNSGKPGIEYEYTLYSTDPEGDPVMYFIDWGDDTAEWTEYSDSGQEITLKHSWDKKGEYIIKAKANDNNDAESDWSYFEVEIPRTRIKSYTILMRLFNLFPNAFPILKQFLGLN